MRTCCAAWTENDEVSAHAAMINDVARGAPEHLSEGAFLETPSIKIPQNLRRLPNRIKKFRGIFYINRHSDIVQTNLAYFVST